MNDVLVSSNFSIVRHLMPNDGYMQPECPHLD